ncbi:MAG: aldehyde dehydrogenase family protein [Planctomycetota bacterium]|nr:aldehyde dehydrogenase family protein [Planctomycetota bacterium]
MRAVLVAGEWRDSERSFSVTFPYDGSVVDEVALPDRDDFDSALSCAYQVFKKKDIQPVYERIEVLRRAAQLVEKMASDFVETIVLEAGKTVREAQTEVSRAIATLTLCSEEASRLGGEVIQMEKSFSSRGYYGITRRFPVGVVLAITPFNFPLNLVCHKVGPAIAAGCPVVLKPSRKVPLSSLKLAEVLLEAGLDDRFLSVVPAESSVAEEFVSDKRVAFVSFTGSAEIGWRLRTLAEKQHVTLELGGNAGCIVCSDSNLEFAVKRSVYGAFTNAGQVCVSLQRILVEEAVFDEFVERFVEETEHLEVGDPRDEKTDMGPMISVDEAQRVKDWVNEDVQKGAELLTPLRVENTLFYPLVLTNTGVGMKVWDEEVFAPVVCVEMFEEFEEAVRRIDETKYGLQAGIFTSDLRRIEYAFKNIHTGALMVNEVPTFRQDGMPYGGVKMSGIGKEGPRYAIREMTEERLMVLNTLFGG